MAAFLDANLAVLEELFAGLTALVAPLDDAALNWSPIPGDANSIAAMVTHIVGSLDNWLARATGETISRDRNAEFRARAAAAELLAMLDGSLNVIRRRFAILDRVDPAKVRRVVRLSSNEVSDVTIAWCVEHAVVHAGEHWGQVQLTHQLGELSRDGQQS